MKPSICLQKAHNNKIKIGGVVFSALTTICGVIVLTTNFHDNLTTIVTGATLLTIGLLVFVFMGFGYCIIMTSCLTDNSAINRLRSKRRQSETTQQIVTSSNDGDRQQPLPSWKIQNPNIAKEFVGPSANIPIQDDTVFESDTAKPVTKSEISYLPGKKTR